MLLFHGIPNPVPFAVALIAVKLIGYSLAGWTLQRLYGSGLNFLVFAVLRIASGFVVGLFFLAAGFTVFFSVAELVAEDPTGDTSAVVFIALVVLSRAIVWALLVWALFERGSFKTKRFVAVVALGTLWSCILDTVALATTSLIYQPVDSLMNSLWI